MGRRRLAAAVCLAALLAGAGCVDGVALGSRYPVATEETLGREAGVRWDADLGVTPVDGYNESEREAVLARTMARVERIRGLEFREHVSVEVVSRTTYRERRAGDGGSGDVDHRREQTWEALFLVGEDRRVGAALDQVFGSRVTGYYRPSADAIVIVSDAPTPRIDRTTLAHELVHALQDQHHSFGGGASTRDARVAADGLVEGDAVAVASAYERRCGGGWDCLARPNRGAGDRPVDEGVALAVYVPYAAGPEFVAALRDRGGWAAVDAAYDRFPESTEQVIHPPRYPDDRPADVAVPDRSAPGWRRLSAEPATDTLGEASVYVMLWDAARRVDDGADGPARELATRFDRSGGARYTYSHPLSTGWAGDTIVPYRRGDAFGYVWRSRWDSPAEARAFLAGYRGVLAARGADRVGEGVYVIREGPYADAFRVARRGAVVTVVNAPGVDALPAVHEPE